MQLLITWQRNDRKHILCIMVNTIHGIVQDEYLICWSLEEKLLKALYTFAGEAMFLTSPTWYA